MPSKVSVNKMTVVHAGSDGVTVAFPDVCKTPAPPAPPIPLPYPNVAKSSDAAATAKSVECDGHPVCVKDSNFMLSSGDEAGSLMGVASNKVKGKAEFVNFSFDVQIEGKNVPRALDPMVHNDKNTPPAPLMQPPLPAMPPGEENCSLCGASSGGAEGAGGNDGGAGGMGGTSSRRHLPPVVPPVGPAGPSGSGSGSGAAGTGGAGSGPAKQSATESKIVTVEWGSSSAWCADVVAFRGDVQGGGAPTKVMATIEPLSGGTPQQAPTTVSATTHAGSWQVKDVLPPIVAGHPAKTIDLKVSAAGASSTKPLQVRFAPSVAKTEHQESYHRFALSAADYVITLFAEVRYVKGWGAEVVNLRNHVPAGTGGLLDAEGFAYPGYRWTKVQAGKRKFWDGASWQDFPAGYVLIDADYFGVGIIKKGNDFVSVHGAKWPGQLDDWDPEHGAKAEKIKTWIAEIEKTWTGKFDLRRKDCPSADSSCCRYRIVMKASFTRVETPGPGTIVLADGNIRSNTSLFYIDEPRLPMVAHEVGHYLGNPDEYAGAVLETSLNDDGATAGIDPNSIMGQNMTTVKKRHFRTIQRVFADAVARDYGRTFSFDAVKA